MRIGIDFHSAEREGTGNCTYIRNLVESLIKIENGDEYFLYITDINYPYYERFKHIGNVHLRLVNSKNPFIRIPILGAKTFIDKIDVLHVQYIAPPVHRGRLIVTIHDISFLHFPECFKKFERFRQRILIPINIKKADKILTVSKYSREDIIKSYNVLPQTIEVTYNGVKPIFKPLENLGEKSEVLKHYGISGKFIFFVGRIDARKNISSLIKAFMLLKQKEQIPHQLVISGKEDFLPRQTREEIKISRYKKDIIFTGYLPENYLPLFYNLADVFVYPSLYEGFGLPCLEALSCGCPLVSSNISSIPEIVNGAGLLINPLDTEELAMAIHRVISNPRLREELKEKGLEQAKQFSWGNTAQKTLEVYKKVLR